MQNKTEKQGFWTKIKTLPHSVMNRYVKKHDNTENFQTMYSGVWFIGFAIMGILTLVCFWVDYGVLYGIEYTSSLNHTHSFLSGIGTATVIQFLILIGGGMFFKIVIFKKLRTVNEDDQSFMDSINKNHLLQAVIFGTLFVYGFTWTIELSNKTYFSAKANAIGNQKNLEKNYRSDAALLSNERQKKIKELERSANKTIQSKEVHYNSLIASNTAKYEALKAKKVADAKRYNYTKSKLDRYLAKYDNQAENKKAALLIEKESAIAPIQAALIASTGDIRSTYTTYEKSLDYKTSNNRSELNKEIETTAKETQGRNVTYNCLNVILMIGLLFFAKNSIDDTAAPTGSDDDVQGNTGTEAHRQTSKKGSGKSDTAKNTGGHSRAQDEEYLDYEEIEKEHNSKEPRYFEQDEYSFKEHKGKYYMKHNSTYASLKSLKSWYNTYRTRMQKYNLENKLDLARDNERKALNLKYKISYMEVHFYGKRYDRNRYNAA